MNETKKKVNEKEKKRKKKRSNANFAQNSQKLSLNFVRPPKFAEWFSISVQILLGTDITIHNCTDDTLRNEP